MTEGIKPPKAVAIADPIIIPRRGGNGERQEITHVYIEILRDITINHGEEETGEFIANLPVKIIYKRNVDSTTRIVKRINHGK